MPFVVVDTGELFLLDQLMSVTTPEALILKLFASDTEIEKDTVLADLTEASYDGYDAVELDRSGWTAAVTIGERATSSWQPAPIWFAADSGDQDIYGWYLVNQAEDTLVAASRLGSAPFNVSTTNPLPITPTMRLGSEYVPS